MQGSTLRLGPLAPLQHPLGLSRRPPHVPRLLMEISQTATNIIKYIISVSILRFLLEFELLLHVIFSCLYS